MLRIVPEILAQAVGDELVLMDPRNSRYFSLNAVGAEVWRGLEQARDPAQIRRDLQARYEVDAGLLAADIERTLGELIAAGLVSESP